MERVFSYDTLHLFLYKTDKKTVSHAYNSRELAYKTVTITIQIKLLAICFFH